MLYQSLSQWPWDLRRGSAAANILRFRVRIAPESRKSVPCHLEFLRWTHHSSGGVLPSVVWLI